MEKITVVASAFLMIATSFSTFSAPREIVIIRHGDKWAQKNDGPYLSAKGQVRAEKFAQYYLKTFPKPDYIFATRFGDEDHPSESKSLRPLLTVIPLASELAAIEGPKAKDQGDSYYRVQMPYFNNQFKQLADDLLKKPAYQNKMILICWHHGHADRLAAALGVTQPLAKWEGNNFDMVYVLKYDAKGKLTSFQILKNQYPVKGEPTWDQLANESH